MAPRQLAPSSCCLLTARLVLKCWTPACAWLMRCLTMAFKDLLTASLSHCRPTGSTRLAPLPLLGIVLWKTARSPAATPNPDQQSCRDLRLDGGQALSLACGRRLQNHTNSPQVILKMKGTMRTLSKRNERINQEERSRRLGCHLSSMVGWTAPHQ